MVDAIVRTLVRLYVTRRHLLEWQTAAQVKADRDLDLARLLPADGRQRRACRGRRLAVGRRSIPSAAWIAAPFVVLWLAAPWIARQISLPGRDLRTGRAVRRTTFDTLRLIARRTWLFFETLRRHQRHGLPPDNFQDDPQPLVAHRTSPTNIGMYLLSTVSARDFGWIGTLEMVERLEATLATIGRLERFHGHLYNWYDTQTCSGSSPSTSPPSTAATSPAICWRCPTPVAR